MKFFLDTAEIEDIKKAVALGICDGITTNPTLIMKSGRNQKDVIQEIAKIVSGPISAEGIGDTTEEMVKEAEEFSTWAKNIVVKVPMTKEGLNAVRILSKKGIKTNVTLVFSPSQALLAAKAGATYVSPFVGRLDDIKEDGMLVISEIMQIFRNYGFATEVIVASVRSTKHVVESAKLGAHIATIPPKVLEIMWHHSLTDKGIQTFKEHYEKHKNTVK
ncbi:fructose-6-phosphate aldolase [Candidatus Micrarchaeota archaeon]|nr:fructose-6-phosphate aldolase [Candidatus Micrarchaeota archaeon]MBU1886907.1 fructose-6-phosphate aldolase [Candidatus Micrarchaeota archaeon]